MTPINCVFVANSRTASTVEEIGVRIMDEKRLLSARPVAVALVSNLLAKRTKKRGIPVTLGQIPLIRIPSASKGFASDRTAPTTACFEVPYIGATGKG